MILKGSQRAGAKQLSRHLLNERDNDHVTVLDVRGFVAEELGAAFAEAHAISKATKCKQFLFFLSLNPPKDGQASEQDFLDAVDRAEKALGLEGQPRAIIMHEKEGRRHAHAVWSRIDAETMTARNLPFFKERLNGLSKELFLEHDWRLPDGLRVQGGKSPLNFTLAEWQQAKRQAIDPREIKDVFRDAWERSDTVTALGNALAERGYFLAQGDRRGFVAVDVQGEIYALSRWVGVKTNDVNDRLGSPSALPSVQEVKKSVRSLVTQQLLTFIADVKAKHAKDAAPLLAEKAALVAAQKAERARLAEGQAKRWQVESQERSDRLRSGLRGFLDTITGRAKAVREANALEAFRCAQRDQRQRDTLVLAQIDDRQGLQKRFDALKKKQVQDRRLLARDVTQFLRAAARRSETGADRAQEATRPRDGGRNRGSRFEL